MTLPETAVLLAALAGIGAAASAPARAAEEIEGPRYTVVDRADGVELRRYAPRIVAEVTVEAPSRDAASGIGFRPLAGYIFGGNAGSAGIAMTAPVTTAVAEGGDGLYTVRFSMPSQWTMETLPAPNDPDVTLREIPAETRLACRFVGMKRRESIDAADAAILQYAARKGLVVSATPVIAGYDGPRTPQSDRRWEVMRSVGGE